VDSKLKVKICRSQSSTNDWYIPQIKSSVQLPDLINSCEHRSKYKKKLSIINKPRRRIRFIPTMVQIPPSIFDREFDTFQSDNIESDEVKQSLPICKVPPCIRDSSSIFESATSLEKLSSIDLLYDNAPLDLSLK
jgi:hypothetical protein